MYIVRAQADRVAPHALRDDGRARVKGQGLTLTLTPNPNLNPSP